MKKINYVWLMLALVVLAVGITSCKKGGDDPKSKTELLSKTWKVQKATVGGTQVYITGGGAANVEDFDAYRLTFTGTTFKRVKSSTTSDEGTWSFANSEATIKFSTGTPAEANITTLSENELTISYTETTAPGKPARNVVLFLIPA